MKYCLLFLSILFASCSVNKANRWDKASFDNKYNLNLIGYNERISHLPEPEEDSLPLMFQHKFYKQSKLKTSNVSYTKVFQRGKEHSVFTQAKNICHVYFPKSDTLAIRVGWDWMMGIGCGSGFFIFYRNSKFYTIPYISLTIYIPNAPQPTYKIRKQVLVLDKKRYNVGDSVYGKIYFHVSETLDNRKFNKG
jgi:hypothetical protein